MSGASDDGASGDGASGDGASGDGASDGRASSGGASSGGADFHEGGRGDERGPRGAGDAEIPRPRAERGPPADEPDRASEQARLRGLEAEVARLRQRLFEPPRGALALILLRATGQRVALRLADVAEVVQMVALAASPLACDGLRGVLDLRGEPIPVFDLAARLGWGEQAIGLQTPIVVCRSQQAALGLIVEAVDRLADVAAGRVSAASPTPSSPAIVGLVEQDEAVAHLVDPFALLAPEEGGALARAVSERTPGARDGLAPDPSMGGDAR